MSKKIPPTQLKKSKKRGIHEEENQWGTNINERVRGSENAELIRESSDFISDFRFEVALINLLKKE